VSASLSRFRDFPLATMTHAEVMRLAASHGCHTVIVFECHACGLRLRGLSEKDYESQIAVTTERTGTLPCLNCGTAVTETVFKVEKRR
jgi:hypothetical protein